MITHTFEKKKKNKKKTMSDLFAGLYIMYARRVDLYGDDMTHDEIERERERTTRCMVIFFYLLRISREKKKKTIRERTTNVKNHFLWANGQGHPRGLCRYICCCSRNDSTAYIHFFFGFLDLLLAL